MLCCVIGEHTRKPKKYLQESLALAQIYDDAMGESIALNILGQIASLEGDLPQAESLCRQAIKLKRTIGDQWGITYSLTYLGRVAQSQGKYNEANRLFQESKTIYEEIGDKRGIAFAVSNLADTTVMVHDYDNAQWLYQEALELYRTIGNLMEASQTLIKLGSIACTQRQFEVAEVSLHEGLALAWSIRSTPALLVGLVGMAELNVATSDLVTARYQLDLVLNHAGTNEIVRRRAAGLRAEITAKFPQSIAILSESVTLESYVEEMRLS